MKSRYHIRNETEMVEFPFNPEGLAQAKTFRKNYLNFKRRKIRHVCQAFPERIEFGKIYKLT